MTNNITLVSIKLESGENIVANIVSEHSDHFEIDNPIQIFFDTYGNLLMKKWIPGLSENIIHLSKSKIVAFSSNISQRQREIYFEYLEMEFSEAFESDATTAIRSGMLH